MELKKGKREKKKSIRFCSRLPTYNTDLPTYYMYDRIVSRWKFNASDSL